MLERPVNGKGREVSISRDWKERLSFPGISEQALPRPEVNLPVPCMNGL